MTTMEILTARYAKAMDELTAAGNMLAEVAHPLPSEVRAVQEKIAARYELRIEELWSKDRPSRIATPRMIAMYYLRTVRGMTTIEIGKYFLKDHTSVSAAALSIRDRMSVDAKFRHEVEEVCAELTKDTSSEDHEPTNR